MDPRNRPLVYACSGCSSVAQLTNRLAVELDRSGKVEMSCISGVGGGVPVLVKLARSGRAVVALDGCALACAKACLTHVGVTPDVHFILNKMGAKKRYGADCSESEEELVRREVLRAVDTLIELSANEATTASK